MSKSPETKTHDALSEIAGGQPFDSRREIIAIGLNKALNEGNAHTAIPILSIVGNYGNLEQDSILISRGLESPVATIKKAAEKAQQRLQSRTQTQ